MCNSDTGIIGCCQSHGSSDFIPMGLGMVVYFKILKAFTIVFLLINLINIPLYFVYMSSHQEYSPNGYKDYFFKTTIGNIGSCKI